MSRALDREFLDKVKSLLPTIVNEHREEQILDSTFNRYNVIKANVLLIEGEKREDWAHQAVQVLEKTITNSQTVILPKLDHLAPDNKYSPSEVAQCVKKFFLIKE